MINYGKTHIQTASDDVVKISSEMWLSYEHTDIDAMTYGTPAYWDEALLSILGSSYDLYELYSKKIPHNKCNRVTDRKMIWGLLGLPKGLFSSQLDYEDYRLYFGLTRITQRQFLSSGASIFLALPVEEHPSVEEAWTSLVEALRNNNGIFTQSMRMAFKDWVRVVALHYSCIPDAELTLICSNPCDIAKKMNSIQPPEEIMSHYRCFLDL